MKRCSRLNIKLAAASAAAFLAVSSSAAVTAAVVVVDRRRAISEVGPPPRSSMRRRRRRDLGAIENLDPAVYSESTEETGGDDRGELEGGASSRPIANSAGATAASAVVDSSREAAAVEGSADTEYDGSYNTRIGPCPGYEERGDLEGYSSFPSLRADLADYFDSFVTATPTASPSATLVPTPDTRSPTPNPSVSPTLRPTKLPSVSPTPMPSDIPTKAPITLRPTPFPTSSIRQDGDSPTYSPQPTMEVFIVGMIDTDGDGVLDGMDLDGDGMVDEVVMTVPPGADGGIGGGMGGGIGFAGPPPAPLPPGLTMAPAAVGGEDGGGGGNTLDQFMDNRRRGQAVVSNGGRRLVHATNAVAYYDNQNEGGKHDNKYSRHHHRLQGEAVAVAGTGISANELDSQTIVENGMMEEVQIPPPAITAEEEETSSIGSGGNDGTATTMTEEGATTASSGSSEGAAIAPSSTEGGGSQQQEGQPIMPMSENGGGTYQEDSSEEGALASNTTLSESSPEMTTMPTMPTVRFQICPNSNFGLAAEASDSLVDAVEPLVLETPAQHPMEISCMPDGDDPNSCVFEGGDVHVLFKHIPDNPNKVVAAAADDDTENALAPSHPITIYGITFRSASQTSVLMNDPRGRVSFRECAWEENEGKAAILIDGRFDSLGQAELEGEYDKDPEDNGGGGGGGKISETSSTIDWSIMDTTSTSEWTSTVATQEGKQPAKKPAKKPGKGKQEDRNLGWTMMSTVASSYDEDAIAALPEEEGEESDSGRQGYGPPSDSYVEEQVARWEEELLFRYQQQIEEEEMEWDQEERATMRFLAEESPTLPRSMISIEKCSFRGNKGSATIMISSYSDELTPAEPDPGVLNHNNGTADDGDSDSGGNVMRTSSIHIAIKETAFVSEDVDESIIENYGARLQSSHVVFTNNTASAIIKSDEGTLAMTSTEFSMNELKGDGGTVVLDFESALEENKGNCNRHHDKASSEGSGLVSSGERQSSLATTTSGNGTLSAADVAEDVLAVISCEGISSGGACSSFQSCADENPMAMTTLEDSEDKEKDDSEDKEKDPADAGSGTCFSVWEDLVSAVRDRQPTGVRDFIICPGAVLVVTSEPVVIDSDYVTIQCGTETSPSYDCVVEGGNSHFRIEGSPSGVQLARLNMMSSTGVSSIVAFGGAGSTLNLIDCKWTKNEGGSVILIGHGESSLNSITAGNNNETQLDILLLLAIDTETTSAMSVEVANCTLANNELGLGAITNIGGTLKVSNSRFSENISVGGEIVVTDGGLLHIHGSCFDTSLSVAPGIVFLGAGSEVESNVDNFGYGNTAGGYGDEQMCTDLFQEAEGANCLDSSTGCNGSCLEFTSAACALDADPDNAMSPKDDPIFVPAYSKSDGLEGPSNVVPIVVAVVVCIFIVFGLVGIVLRRRKGKKASNGGNDASNNDYAEGRAGGGLAVICGCCKRGQRDGTNGTHDEVEEEDHGAFGEDIDNDVA
eukprot:CAMPEP_0181113666 /NCGR_PEP_ID=MMETSP1071-20121207/20468_1 /TAXON_ID=35127 /ORGANISM="Thalassiosira sp., Strain NH16" /LENGTH=1480 /DNA_ID=CAMNT_0023197717 /DNA_START=10 /DNA_END=4452 /DNA_ORIENTATION=-